MGIYGKLEYVHSYHSLNISVVSAGLMGEYLGEESEFGVHSWVIFHGAKRSFMVIAAGAKVHGVLRISIQELTHSKPTKKNIALPGPDII